jgi:hypothetical protein
VRALTRDPSSAKARALADAGRRSRGERGRRRASSARSTAPTARTA